MLLSDTIASFIDQMLNDCGGTLEIKRNDLAKKLGCVPSQINYVVASRFTPERGYLIESRRGGGGYIRIVRREIDAQEGDNTEEISHRVHELLKDRSLLLRRIHEAYPELQARPHAMMERLHDAQKEFKAANRRFKALVRETAQAQKKQVGQKLEDSKRLEEAREALRAAKSKLHAMQQKFSRHEDEV